MSLTTVEKNMEIRFIFLLRFGTFQFLIVTFYKTECIKISNIIKQLYQANVDVLKKLT